MDFKQYMGKDILAWLFYKENQEDPNGGINNRCYVYPRFIHNGITYENIDPTDFPQRGSIEIRIQGGESAEDLYGRVGSFVKLKINGDAHMNPVATNYYNLKYSHQHGRGSSEIWLEPFNGRDFYQIVDVDRNIDELQHDRSIPTPKDSIYTNTLLLRYNDKLYGPFENDQEEENLMLRASKGQNYTIGEYNCFDLNDELLVIADQNDEDAVVLIPKTAILLENAIRQFDWISSETLIANFIESLGIENSYSKAQVRQLKEMALQFIEQNATMSFSEERVLRIKALFSGIFQYDENIQTILQYILADESTTEIIINEIISNHFDQIKNKITAFATMQDYLDELTAQKIALENQVQQLQASAEPDISEDTQNKIDELQRVIEALQQEKEGLLAKISVQEEIEELKAEQDALRKERDELKRERDRAKENYKQQLLDNSELEKQFSSTLESFNDRAKQTARILDSKLLDKILRGVGEEQTGEMNEQFDPNMLHSNPMDCFEIIKHVTSFIESAHRTVSANDVANYLICISQGFITTFAGEPGTGKTSLCNILAKALGLVVDTPQKRFVDISVERGWTSHKDFIGYYNPLTKTMEKSNMEVFNAFARMNSECGCDQSKIAPFVILLDEANLSPIEHYWAAFLRNCDFTSVSNRTISLGGNNNFKLPEHLRFLATVNFDHTTEDLSPRFLDRSWVIMLEPSGIDDDTDEDIANCVNMLSFGDIKEAFCVKKTDIIDEAIENKWIAIQRIFKEHSLQIMPRNLKMVKNYCAVGCRCMDRDTPTTKLAPLDYAFSQKILPTINGNGENYCKLIDALFNECKSSMPISAKHLERMKRVADNNMGFYQFFSR